MWNEVCSVYSPDAENNDIEFTGEVGSRENKTIIEENGQIRIWNYKTGKVEYYEADEKIIEKISKLSRK